jgi:hypothetical protein
MGNQCLDYDFAGRLQLEFLDNQVELFGVNELTGSNKGAPLGVRLTKQKPEVIDKSNVLSMKKLPKFGLIENLKKGTRTIITAVIGDHHLNVFDEGGPARPITN